MSSQEDWIGYDAHRPRADYCAEAWEAGMRIDDKVLSCVVFIGHDKGGHFTPFGTGFMAWVSTGGRLFQHIVTARHVIDDHPQERYCIRINQRSGRVEHTYAERDGWVCHPDPNVDLALCPTHVPPETYDIAHIHLNQDIATADVIAEMGIGVGEDIFTAGMFTRHLGEALNRPIARTGTIAAMPAERIETSRGSLPAYLVEARSIAGLSGSPVFVQLAPWRILPSGEVRQTTGRGYYFLGVMQGHFQTADATDVVSPDVLAPGDMNAGIGVAIPGERILEITELPQLKDRRESILAKMQKDTGFVADSAAKREPSTTADNPSHREDFNRLLGEAARKPKRGGGT